MQNKLIAAAAIASSASTLRLEAPKTALAQDTGYAECHGTYAYQCIEQKVDTTLADMTADVRTHKDECLVTANDLREQIVEGVQELRSSLESQLAELRASDTIALEEKLESATSAINVAVAEASSAIMVEADARINGTAEVSIERKRIEGEIKKLYYEAQQPYDPYQMKHDMKEKVKEFEDFVNNGNRFVDFTDAEVASVEQVITYEVACLNDAINDAMERWNNAAANATINLNSEIANKIAEMEQIIADKTADINAVIDHLTEDFIVVFWDTVEEIFQHVSYYERQGLVWKALYQKDAFLAEVSALRDELIQELANVRSELVSELNDERDALAENISGERMDYAEQNNAKKSNLQDVVHDAREALQKAIDDANQKLKDNHADDEVATLEKFVYDLSEIQYNPSSYGGSHHDGYQPYAKWVANEIQDNISVFGDEAFATFVAETTNALEQLQNKLADQKAQLAADNANAQAALDNKTADLITGLTNTREAIEMILADHQDAQEAQDEEKRDLDQIALVTTKNELWKDLSWVVRKTLAAPNGHEHGLSGGAVYGHIPIYAQVSAQSSGSGAHGQYIVYDNDYYEPIGFGAEGPDDGYDPYGVGDQGFGYGYGQFQFKEVQEILKKMESAKEEFIAKNEHRIDVSQAELEEVQAQACVDFETALEAKQATMTQIIEDQNAAWAANVSDRTNMMNEAVENTRYRINEAKRIKNERLDEIEKMIRWHITSIYNYEVQHSLNEALTTARAEKDAECAALLQELMDAVDQVAADWSMCVASETASLNANTDEETARCEAAQVEQNTALYAFKAAQQTRFDEWAESERQAVQDFADECWEAWTWILESYCLAGNDGGCSWGNGSGYGNAGIKKGVPVELHDDILSYGQELNIKHIHNIPGLIQHAVEFTMEGVPEEAAAQKQQVNEKQANIEAEVDAARVALENELAQKLSDAMAELDATVDRLAQELRDREDAAIGVVDEDRQAYTQEVIDLREQLLWDIKELVWKLGYTQGYKYGAHDGHDHELKTEIAAKKDSFEAKIQEVLATMVARVEQETADGNAANQAAREELQGEIDRVNSEMEQALQAALDSFEQTLQSAKADMNEEIQRAQDALWAFIDERLALWQTKYDQEKKNALWQEDSYYRYGLLKLLQAKQDAIDAAVAEVKADFLDMMAMERAEAQAERASQRARFAQFVVDIRQALQNAIEEDDSNMEYIIAEREASLAQRLADQQAQLQQAMDDCRDKFRAALKEIYNYNSYDIDVTKSPDPKVAPYTHEQHRAFLHKFAYWLKEKLGQIDAQTANNNVLNEAQIVSYTEDACDDLEEAQRAIEDQSHMAKKSLQRLSEDIIEQFREDSAAEAELLALSREAIQAAAESEAERLQKEIIYAMHVIRYAGGKDRGSFGFGNFASSYYGKGNALTGVDELDLWRAPNGQGYAQVSSIDYDEPWYQNNSINSDDEQLEKVKDMLKNAKEDFDEMIQACKADFSAVIESEKEASAYRLAIVNEEMKYAVDAANQAQQDLAIATNVDMANSNADRKNEFSAFAYGNLSDLYDKIEEYKTKVSGWFDDKIEWLYNMRDSQYKAHLVDELNAKKNAALASLDGKLQIATDDTDEAYNTLCDNLEAKEAQLADTNQMAIDMLAEFGDDIIESTNEQGMEIDDAFCDAALAEGEAKIEYADQLTLEWAYWLRYIYGYQGYHTSLYQDYDDTEDYSNGVGRDSLVGDYPDLGAQGTGASSSGLQHLPSAGRGYGGPGGVDYIYSDDHLGLVYGKETGPDPQFFNGSILDDYHHHEEEQHTANSYAFDMSMYSGELYSGLSSAY